ncbi:MAG: polysaccharide deacetylase family protein [Lachnospiraceae bacterium]|nr:polysaccharide deacetylase family protein [Lachnospiraceae bacterium]
MKHKDNGIIDENLYDKKSFRARSRDKMIKRERRLRRQILMVCICVILLVSLVGIIWMVSDFNKAGKKVAGKPDNSVAAGKNVTEKPTATPVPTPTPTKEPEGKEKWLRKDLDPDKPMVALTFDDGPYSPVTDKILKTLKKYDARATFFTVGNRISTYESSVKKAYEQGNQIASHTYSHVYLTQISNKKIKKELARSNKAIKKAIGCGFDTLRPPGGMVNDSMKKVINVPMIYWSVDTEDWSSRNTDKILAKCKSIKDGDIVLMHDLYPTTANAVKKLVPRLVKKGYQIVTIDELFYYKGIDAKGGVVYFSGR